MASIKEVAKLAGVSAATVSRVMNGTANVAPDKKERVLSAISETGFVPNEVARCLFKKSAKTIGLIIPNIKNPFFTQLASIIENTADKHGYRLIFCNTGNQLEKEKAALSMLASMNADGIILASSNDKIEPFVRQCSIPVVIIDRIWSKKNIDAYVHCDHYSGGKMAAEYLMECGCKNIVCVKGPKEISSAMERYEGYREVCKQYGIKEQTIDCTYDFQAGLVVTEKLLHTYPKVDGIIACNDMVAISIYKILHKKKILVPDKIQLIGFDGVDLSELITPELTTIAQPIEEIGKQAVELIVYKKEKDIEKKEYIFSATLIVRETTKKKGET